MSEYKIDFDIPSMKKEQLKTIRVNIVRALIGLGLVVLFSYLGAGPVPAFYTPAVLLFLVLVYLVVMLFIGICRYLRYARKHSVDLVTVTSDTINVDGDVYKRGSTDLSFRIERGLRYDLLNLTGCLLVVNNKKDPSRNVYWIGPKKHFDSEFKRDMLLDSICEEEVNCLYVSDVPKSEEMGNIEINIRFPYKNTLIRQICISLFLIALGVAQFIATANGVLMTKRGFYEIDYQWEGLFQNFTGGVFIIMAIGIYVTPYVTSNILLKNVRITNDRIFLNDNVVFLGEGTRVRTFGLPFGNYSHIFIEAGHRTYWAGYSDDNDCDSAVRCFRNSIWRVCPSALIDDRLGSRKGNR